MLNGPKLTHYEIKTLGAFEIKKNGMALSTGKTKNSNVWDALKLMMTFRDRGFSAEELIDRIYADSASSDPKALLRKQMQRLREMLLDENDTPPILHDQGVYRWHPDVIASIDVDVFETLIAEGDTLQGSNTKEAIRAYLSALDLYGGDYLSDCSQLWVYGVRNHYRLLYVDAVYKSVHLLKATGQYDLILYITEKAIQVDMYEKKFHMYYIESLYMQGNRKTALEHYQKITSHLYTTYNLSPSHELLSLYKKMMQEKVESGQMLASEGAYLCAYDVFLSICDLEKRRSNRSGEPATMGTLVFLEKNPFDLKTKTQVTSELLTHLLTRLRKSDCLSKKSDFEIAIMLPGVPIQMFDFVIQKHLKHFKHGHLFKISEASTL